MQKKTRMIAMAAAASLLTLGGLAGLASADMGEGMMGRGHGMMGRHLMERYDADKDGKVTQAEIDKSRQERLAEFDADKNGTLSLEEFKLLWLKSRNEMMVREFQFFDKDGNGVVTIEEYQAPMSDLVTRRDVNNDGALGPEDQRVQRLRRGDGPAWGKGMGEGHGMGHGRGNCEGHGWGQSDDESESAEPSDEKAPAEEQSTP